MTYGGKAPHIVCQTPIFPLRLSVILEKLLASSGDIRLPGLLVLQSYLYYSKLIFLSMGSYYFIIYHFNILLYYFFHYVSGALITAIDEEDAKKELII